MGSVVLGQAPALDDGPTVVHSGGWVGLMGWEWETCQGSLPTSNRDGTVGEGTSPSDPARLPHRFYSGFLDKPLTPNSCPTCSVPSLPVT